jgi:hypothetical protein
MSNQTVRAIVTRSALLVTFLFAAAACGGGSASGGPGATPGPTIIPGPSGGATLTAGQLRLLLVDTLGERWYCDPDEYPVAHGTEQERAVERFAEMVAENDIYRAVAAKLGINVDAALTDAQKTAIYHLWKIALSIPLDPIGDGKYRFDYLAVPVNGATEGTRTGGVIDSSGRITVEQTAVSGEPICPICLARGTLIDTPAGPIAIDRLRLGDPIWTLDAGGRRVAATVIALGSTTAPPEHHVIRLVLADGRSVTASPGHPLADGRRLGELAIGDIVDGSRVVELVSLPYSGGETFDLVASGATGIYLSGGIPLGSTLQPQG